MHMKEKGIFVQQQQQHIFGRTRRGRGRSGFSLAWGRLSLRAEFVRIFGVCLCFDQRRDDCAPFGAQRNAMLEVCGAFGEGLLVGL